MGIIRHLRLTVFLGGIYLRRLAEYRIDFLIGTGSFAVIVLVQIVAITAIYRHVPDIRGWRYEQALFLFGFSLIPRGLDHLFTDHLWELGRKLIQRGEFYKYLIRPLNPLFNLLSERFFYPDGLGEFLVGVAITCYAGARLGLELSAVQYAVSVGLVLCGATIFLSIKLLFGSLSFWTVTSLPAMTAVYELASFSKYPLDIYGRPVRFILIYVVPFGLTAYVPAIYLLFGDTELLYLCPIVAVVAFAFSYWIWRKGVQNYEMTGS